MARYILKFGLCIIFLLLLASSVVFSEGPEDNELTFCHFGPKVKIFDPKIEADGCNGTVKVQALMWECAPPSDNGEMLISFRKKLAQLAADECSKHCERRKEGCTGKLKPVIGCGLETDSESSIIWGRKFGCRKDCSGSALSYCSLYDAGFRAEDPVRTASQAPNCRCRSSGK